MRLRCRRNYQRTDPITPKNEYHEKLEKARSLKRSGRRIYGDEREISGEPYRTATKVKKLGAADSVHGTHFCHLVHGAAAASDAGI